MTQIEQATQKIRMIFISHGLKSGPIPRADLYLDCRVIPNPFHRPELAGKSGEDPQVQAFVEEVAGGTLASFEHLICDMIASLPARRGKDWSQRPAVICCLCAHGIHRSQAVKHILARWAESVKVSVEVH